MDNKTLRTEGDPRLFTEPVGVITLTQGSVVNSWCSACHATTPHAYRPYDLCKLACLRCEEATRGA